MPKGSTLPAEDVAPKKHAACDECLLTVLCTAGTRKLKCSGEQAGCRRCVKQGLACHYSIQKQMGRPPKKRRMEGDDGLEKPETPPIDILTEVEKDWSTDNVTADAVHLIPQLYLGDMSRHNNTQPLTPAASAHRLKPIAATAGPWPDFATTSASAAMLSVSSGLSGVSYDGSSSSGASEHPPQCPCLSYLYLCLSTISSLNSFSINFETINSLCTAARTAQSVIRCEICPLNFATGVQNVMMLGTLLSVMADAWYKIAQVDAGTLGREITSPEFQELIISNDQDTKETWQIWLRQVLRRAIIGVPIHINLCQQTVACTKTPDLLSLIREMEARQRKWHAEGISQFSTSSKAPFSSDGTPSSFLSSDVMGISPGSTPNSASSGSVERLSPDEVEKQQDVAEREYLCLKIVGAAKHVIHKFGFLPSEYPVGVDPI
ncbi:hypothetical protein UA08_04327 [Talaromyces atroroseus]|uniref:Zn(2)-C6 fungal-type domain-containing protein n=1 Tax=Talaromyces atroroseus TaxID=1441469 RepID=A0A1Q5Q8I8_TALAT|nr:hypothetical protein UA08_04327 [Talaromyces atroroseus]OKL60446.1 hypothetical protein UA08_04327 [Talaromyces atroroseus]